MLPHSDQAIEHRPTVRDRYLKHLLALGKVTEEEATQIADTERADLEKQFNEAKVSSPAEQPAPAGFWQPYFGGSEPDDGPHVGRLTVRTGPHGAGEHVVGAGQFDDGRGGVGVAGLLDLARLHLRRPEVGDRRSHHEYMRVWSVLGDRIA